MRPALAAIAALTLLLSGCGSTTAPRPTLERYTLGDAALAVDVPVTWGSRYSWRVARPTGLGLLVAEESTPGRFTTRFTVSASSTALRETSTRPAPTSTETFQRALTRAWGLSAFRVASADCTDSVRRPITDDRLYGRITTYRHCRDGETVSRLAAVDAQRRLVVTIEARGHPGEATAPLVEDVLVSLDVDVFALPVEPVAKDELNLIDR